MGTARERVSEVWHRMTTDAAELERESRWEQTGAYRRSLEFYRQHKGEVLPFPDGRICFLNRGEFAFFQPAGEPTPEGPARWEPEKAIHFVDYGLVETRVLPDGDLSRQQYSVAESEAFWRDLEAAGRAEELRRLEEREKSDPHATLSRLFDTLAPRKIIFENAGDVPPGVESGFALSKQRGIEEYVAAKKGKTRFIAYAGRRFSRNSRGLWVDLVEENGAPPDPDQARVLTPLMLNTLTDTLRKEFRVDLERARQYEHI